ncbi:unnamed protein product, partial [Ixodes persulcatus]
PERRKQTTTNAIKQTKPAKRTNKETKTTRDHLTETQKGHHVTKKRKSMLRTKNVEENLEKRNQTGNRSQSEINREKRGRSQQTTHTPQTYRLQKTPGRSQH